MLGETYVPRQRTRKPTTTHANGRTRQESSTHTRRDYATQPLRDLLSSTAAAADFRPIRTLDEYKYLALYLHTGNNSTTFPETSRTTGTLSHQRITSYCTLSLLGTHNPCGGTNKNDHGSHVLSTSSGSGVSGQTTPIANIHRQHQPPLAFHRVRRSVSNPECAALCRTPIWLPPENQDVARLRVSGLSSTTDFLERMMEHKGQNSYPKSDQILSDCNNMNWDGVRQLRNSKHLLFSSTRTKVRGQGTTCCVAALRSHGA